MQSRYSLPAPVAGPAHHARRLPSTRLLLGALLLAAGPVAAQSYAPTGVQQNVPEATVTGGGWSVCYSQNFTAQGTSVASVLAACDRDQVMLACRQVGAANYSLLAQAPRADVFFDTGANANVTQDANGVGWYFHEDWSMGFAPQGEAVDKQTCDWDGNGPQTVPEQRMCVHLRGGAIDDGYRCGVEYAPDVYNGTWEWAILHAGSAPVTLGTVLTRAGSSDPQVVAEELRIPPTRTFANPVGAFNLSSTLEYAFSDQEVRYARLECPGVTFDSGAVTLTGPAGSVVGAINGMGSSAITFSITAGATPLVASNTFTVDGTRTLTGKDPVSCRYGLYDTPSQAQAGGADGRIVTTSGQYLSFGPSYQLAVDAQGRATADVEAELAFGEFVLEASAIDYDLAQLGRISYGATDEVTGDDQPITLDGEAVTLPELLAATTTLRVAGDFSVADAVYLSTAADCSVVSLGSSSLTDSEAVVTVGNTSRLDHYVCYQTDGAAIPESVYSVALTAVSATPALYATANRGPLSLGEVLRNGTQLQAPFAQVPGGWQSRLVLTNTGGIARAYSLTVQGEAGNVIETGDLSGVIPANGTLVIEDLNTVLTGFSAAPRATINVNAAGPTHQIQGLYQIVDPAKGTISNHVLVRPGSN